MYKAIFIDIDGTLRDNNKNISGRTINAIEEITKKGILVILCSGRPRKYTENLSRQCKASKYIITSSGGSIYDYEENKLLSVNSMDKKACIELYNIAKKVDARYIMSVGDDIVVNRLKYFDGSEKLLKDNIETFVEENDIIQITVADNDFEKMKNLEDRIKSVKKVEIKNRHKSLIDSNVPRDGSIYYDISSLETYKGNAIKKFCEILNIDLKDTVAIGDDYNDISMFNVVGHSVIMGNANDEIKKYANEITSSNEEDGVAVFLEKLLDEEV